jgi:hypothetical protein
VGTIPVAEWIAQWMPPSVAEATVVELHPEAAASFDARVQALLLSLSSDPIPKKESSGSLADIYAPRVYDVSVLHEELPALDETGYLSISDETGRLSLRGKHYVELVGLSKRLHGKSHHRRWSRVVVHRPLVARGARDGSLGPTGWRTQPTRVCARR